MHPITPVRRIRRIITSLVLLLAVLGALVVVDRTPQVKQWLADQISGQPVPRSESADQNNDYFTVTGPAEIEHPDTQTGRITYCEPDRLERPTCAHGRLTSSQRAAARKSDRQEITVDPVGWPDRNAEVSIPGLAGVANSKTYHGWMWNRSHLIADSLGGDASRLNLITGTRMQNVGSAQTRGQYSGGMAHTELLAREYLDNHDGDACPLYYAVTPDYLRSELIPRTVLVDIRSCDGSIDERVVVWNTANGWQMDYTTGEYTSAG